jgi:hypothetical protein
MAGLLGPEAQQQAISGIQESPQFQAQIQAGESALLQNAAATGGLRGGNIQGALAQFRPALLGQAINQRFGQLGGLAQLGQASAAGVGAQGAGISQSIASLLGQQAAAQGAAGIAGGQFGASIPGILSQGLGIFSGLGGFEGLTTQPVQPGTVPTGQTVSPTTIPTTNTPGLQVGPPVSELAPPEILSGAGTGGFGGFI